MKKQLLLGLIVLAFPLASLAGTTYSFVDMIDTWGCYNTDSQIIVGSFSYTHDISSLVNFAQGDTVQSASLELDFTNDYNDNVYTFRGNIIWDTREFVNLQFDQVSLIEIGEQDNGQYTLSVDTDYLNNDGLLEITISAYNFGPNPASLSLDHSKLSGTAATVPTPSAIILAGLGTCVVTRLRRRMTA